MPAFKRIADPAVDEATVQQKGIRPEVIAEAKLRRTNAVVPLIDMVDGVEWKCETLHQRADVVAVHVFAQRHDLVALDFDYENVVIVVFLAVL